MSGPVAHGDPWAVAPPGPPAPRGPRRWPRAVAAGVLGAAGPAVHMWHIAGDLVRPALLLVAAVAATLALATWAGSARRLALLASGAAALGAAVLPSAGATPTALALAAAALAHGALVGWPPPGRAQRLRPFALAAGPVVGAAALWVRTSSRVGTAALLLAALGLLELGRRSPARADRLDAAVARVVQGTASALAAAALLAVVAPMVYLPGAVGRAAEARRRRRVWRTHGSSWRPHRLTLADQRQDARRPFTASAPLVRGARHALALAALLVAVVLVVQIRDDRSDPRTAPATTVPGAPAAPGPGAGPSEGAPWEAMLRVQGGGFYVHDPSTGHRIRDVTSAYVNVRDGARVTPEPPAALGDPIDVWVLGGSAAFGSGQRDAHTVPAELVGLAADDGLAVRVRNYGVPATHGWQSALRLAYLLEWEEPPDLVVLYEGFNDLFAQLVLSSVGLGRSDDPPSAFQGEFDEALAGSFEGLPEELGPVDTVPTTTTPPVTDPRELAEVVLRRYARGLDVVDALAVAHDVEVAAFWQPSLLSKEPRSDDEAELVRAQGLAGDGLALAEGALAAVRAGLAGLGVRDLGDALDGVTDRVYLDIVHTDEQGARRIAEALYAELEPTLRALR